MKTKICVTGGAGFIGSHLVDRLLENKNNQVTVLDNLANGSLENLKDAKKNKNFLFVRGDILKFETCDRVTRSADFIFHLAVLGVRNSILNPLKNQAVNAFGTLNMLEASRKNKVRKFIYISSSEIYGGVSTFPIVESALPVPLTIYGASKLAGEHYAFAYSKCFGLNTTIVRMFNNYGPRSHHENDSGELIPRTIVRAIYDKSPLIFGNGKNSRDFLYVKDSARLLEKFMNLKTKSGEVFNVGSGEEITIENLVKRILFLMKKTKLKIKYLPNRPADVPRLWVDIGKIKKLTDVKTYYQLDDGLKETINYFQDLQESKDLIKEVKIINWR